MFVGTHTPRLDAQGRLVLPAKYQDQLAGGLAITRGLERCLYVFPAPEFARVIEALRAPPAAGKAARDYSRVLFASACDGCPDEAGRVLIPAALREYAGLRGECVVVGVDTRLEIWDARAWAAYLAAQEAVLAGPAWEVLPAWPPAGPGPAGVGVVSAAAGWPRALGAGGWGPGGAPRRPLPPGGVRAPGPAGLRALVGGLAAAGRGLGWCWARRPGRVRAGRRAALGAAGGPGGERGAGRRR